MMRVPFILFLLPMTVIMALADNSTVGIKPEQIYQKHLKWEQVVGAWEALPEKDPLTEIGANGSNNGFRSLMTLRKDGTCRVFDQTRPMGKDGIWNIEGHKMYITFPEGDIADFYVYGVAGDFMVTRSPMEDGVDQLWSRVK